MNAYSSEDIDRLEPAYLKSYGLQEAPFSTVHHDKFMYLDAERAQRINMLQHMVRYSNLLLIVQGVHGVGKTSLLKRFIQTAEPDWQLCEIAANTMIDAEQLLFQAAQGFGVHQLPQDAGELQEMLYARVATFHHNDQTPILIIDDAHELPKDALLAIFNLADTYVNDVNLLRIILFCEPQIEKIISSKDVRALRERVTHTMEIPPFDEEGTAEYLKHRMAAAGFNGSSPFTPKLVKKIYRASRGIPAQINLLAHQALEEGDVLGDSEQPAPEVASSQQRYRKQGKPAIYISAAILLLVLALVFQDQINSIFEDGRETTSENAN
ncbi:MAG: AAA family ATPase, partial [Thioalkalispiraceae bacterium]